MQGETKGPSCFEQELFILFNKTKPQQHRKYPQTQPANPKALSIQSAGLKAPWLIALPASAKKKNVTYHSIISIANVKPKQIGTPILGGEDLNTTFGYWGTSAWTFPSPHNQGSSPTAGRESLTLLQQ